MLLGRTAERAAIDALPRGAREGCGDSLVLTGEPGIGKTTLIKYALEEAAGLRVLKARGYEAESEIPFAGLADLLAPALSGLDDLPGPQAAALRSALALGPPVAGDRSSICAATVGILAAAAETAPVLVVIDPGPGQPALPAGRGGCPPARRDRRQPARGDRAVPGLGRSGG